MDAMVVAVASLGGVVLGAILNPWYEHRAEVRGLFREALSALSAVGAAQNYPTRASPGGTDEAREDQCAEKSR